MSMYGRMSFFLQGSSSWWLLVVIFLFASVSFSCSISHLLFSLEWFNVTVMMAIVMMQKVEAFWNFTHLRLGNCWNQREMKLFYKKKKPWTEIVSDKQLFYDPLPLCLSPHPTPSIDQITHTYIIVTISDQGSRGSCAHPSVVFYKDIAMRPIKILVEAINPSRKLSRLLRIIIVKRFDPNFGITWVRLFLWIQDKHNLAEVVGIISRLCGISVDKNY